MRCKARLWCGALLLALVCALALPSGRVLSAVRAQEPVQAPQRRPRRVPEPPTQPPQPTPMPQPTASPAPAERNVLAPGEDVERVETNLVNILFNAADRERHFITTLKPDDIRVFEDNRPQQIANFERETDLPLSLAILVDVSLSQLKTLPDEKDAAHIFVESIVRPDRDRVSVVSFARDATVEQDLTDNVAKLQHAIDVMQIAPPFNELAAEVEGTGTTPEAARAAAEAAAARAANDRPITSTAIWDTIWATTNEIMAQTPERTRRAIILLSDGADSSSRLKRDEAVEAALKSNTVVYSIGIGDDDFDEGALKKIAERTGGRAFFPEDEQRLRAAFAQIQAELRTQYLISYAPTNKAHDGTFRQVRIDVVNPELQRQKLQLTYRRGYFANPPTPPAPVRPRAPGQRLTKPLRRKH
ncbi:MAG: VWA domain-containing protein [Pyrinomonadaceae bacterium]